MAETSIEWVISPDGSQGHTVNPIRFRNLETGKAGHHCEKISAGCKNCYASAMQKPYLSGLEFVTENRQRGEFFLDGAALESVLRRRIPTTYFWCDMTDLFGSWVPDEWIDRVFAGMALTPQHRHIVLTKRAARMREYWTSDLFARLVCCCNRTATGEDPHSWTGPNLTTIARKYRREPHQMRLPLPNVILGVSCENQAAADERIPHLLRTPAACRMVSMEPLLGDVRLWKLQSLDYHDNSIGYETYPLSGRQAMPDCDWKHPRLDWVIVGGESGPGARPMHPDWARSLRDQCTAAGVPFFFKQWGGVHKKAAGRLLDGRVWDERPEVLNG